MCQWIVICSLMILTPHGDVDSEIALAIEDGGARDDERAATHGCMFCDYFVSLEGIDWLGSNPTLPIHPITGVLSRLRVTGN
jgi:hypothetical protein